MASQLANVVDKLDSIGEEFSLRTVANVSELSAFLQFLAHAMRIAGSDGHAASIDDVEELLRASLLYHQAKKRRGEADLQRLVQLCRSYLAQVRRLPSGTLSLADTTGFATPSVLALLARTRQTPGLRSVAEWSPSSLFGSDIEPLARRIDAIANLPEMTLGNEEGGPFNPKRVAAILRDWVSGASLSAMAETYRLPEDKSTPEKRVTSFSTYLFSRLTGRASWGLGALESVCLAGHDPTMFQDAAHVPSMVFFGVREREAIWMRMVGVPRPIASKLGRVWKAQGRNEPANFDELRGWISGLKDSDWSRVLPKGSRLDVQDMRAIWGEIGGSIRAQRETRNPENR